MCVGMCIVSAVWGVCACGRCGVCGNVCMWVRVWVCDMYVVVCACVWYVWCVYVWCGVCGVCGRVCGWVHGWMSVQYVQYEVCTVCVGACVDACGVSVWG